MTPTALVVDDAGGFAALAVQALFAAGFDARAATTVDAAFAELARGAMAHVGLKCGRSGGSGTFTTEWRNVQTRVLGISP